MLGDLKYALRSLAKAPAFAVIAILTLTLGIGANSAIFSVIDTVLLRPLPYKTPEQLAMVWLQDSTDKDPKQRGVFSFPDFSDLRDQCQSFSALAAYTLAASVLTQGDESQPLEGVAVTSDVFRVTGVNPALGRAYSQDEDKVGGEPVVVITDDLWRRAFANDRNIVGKRVMLNSRGYTVIGVMPPRFKFPVDTERLDYLMPLQTVVGKSIANRGAHFLSVAARLRPGASAQSAKAETDAILDRLSKEYPDTNLTLNSARVVSLHTDLVCDLRPALAVLFGAVVLVLLIACANVANLLLARGAARNREMAIRSALGASRARIVRQLLAESLVLALIGGVGGLLLAWWGVDILRAIGPRAVPRLNEIAVNGQVCAFTFALAIVSTVAFGLLPALQLSRGTVNDSLQQGSKGSTGGAQAQRARATLVIAQIAVSLLLLAGAGLLMKSFSNLRNIPLGFATERVMTASLSLPRVKYPEPDVQQRTFERVFAKLAAVPGVQDVGGVNAIPLGNNIHYSTLMVSGAAPLPPGQHPGAGHLVIAGDYFRAMQIRLLAGRFFTQRDGKDAPLVVMINEAFAKKFFPDRNPVGQQVMIDRDEDKAPPCEVIGVVANTRHDSLSHEPGPEFYVPVAQEPQRHLDVVFRTRAESMTGLHAAINAAVHEIDRDIFVPELRPMQTFLTAHLAAPRFNMLLLAVFAGVAMMLASIGIYGVMAYGVTQRTREIGIRMALGAQRTQMLTMVLRQSLKLILSGIALGFIASLAGTRLLQSMLYGVKANDFLTYAWVVLLLAAAALLASYLPARRAMRVDPMVALRYE